MAWIRTATGRRYDFLKPDPAQMSLMDVCISLSRVPRFGGHSPLVVLQHLLEVAALAMREARRRNPEITEKELAEIGLVSFLHDFPEYVVGDCPTPFKKLLGEAYAEIEEKSLNAFLTKWKLHDIYAKWQDLLKWADYQAVVQEAVRFDLDGILVDEETGERSVVPREWVPDDVEVTLKAQIIPSDELPAIVTTLFIRFMYFAERFDDLEPVWKSASSDAADARGTLRTAMAEPLGYAMFADNQFPIF